VNTGQSISLPSPVLQSLNTPWKIYEAELPGQGAGVESHRSLSLSVQRQGDFLKIQGATGMGVPMHGSWGRSGRTGFSTLSAAPVMSYLKS